MKLILKIVSIVLMIIGVLYTYVAVMALINIDAVGSSLIKNSIIEIPLRNLPQVKDNLLRNNTFILIFGVVSISIGIALFIKNRKKVSV